MIYILYRLLSVPLRSRLPASYIHRMCICVCVWWGGSHDVQKVFERAAVVFEAAVSYIHRRGREGERERVRVRAAALQAAGLLRPYGVCVYVLNVCVC